MYGCGEPNGIRLSFWYKAGRAGGVRTDVGVEVGGAVGEEVGNRDGLTVAAGAVRGVAAEQLARVMASRLRIDIREPEEVRRKGMGRILPEKEKEIGGGL